MLVALWGYNANYTTETCGWMENGKITVNLRYIPLVGQKIKRFLTTTTCMTNNSSPCYPSLKGWWGWVHGWVLKLRSCCFHVVTGHMGRLCSPETIWMCVCHHSRWITTPLFWMQSIHRWELKTCPLKERQDPALMCTIPEWFQHTLTLSICMQMTSYAYGKEVCFLTFVNLSVLTNRQ